MRNLDTALVRAFVAVAETGGMTSAANILHLTQAAVSQQIKRLEDLFGTQLFERERKGMRLTAVGERLFERAKRFLAQNDEIWAEMTAPVAEGQVRLGIPHDIVHAYLPPVIKTFTQAYPRVEVSLDCSSSLTLLEKLEAGAIDLALTTERECGAGGESLVQDRLVWVGARCGDAVHQRPLPLTLGNDTCRCTFRSAALEALRGAEVDWRAVAEIANVEATNATVQSDLAIGVLMASTVPQGLEVIGAQVGLPLLPAFKINLYLPKTGGTAIAQEMARIVRESFLGRRLQAA